MRVTAINVRRAGGHDQHHDRRRHRWQPHTDRGAIAGALKKKKLVLEVTSEKVGRRGRVYRIGS